MSHHLAQLTNTHCQNCGVELQGPYCQRCGQKDVDFHRSFGHVVHEMLETWFHLDHSFFQGLYNMLFRLGKTTREFNEGKRARHVPPFRFYLVVSLLFFFLIFPSHDTLEQLPIITDAQLSSGHETPGEKTPAGLAAPHATHALPASKRATARDLAGEHEMEPTSSSGSNSLEAALTKRVQHPAEAVAALLHALPKALLVCVPFFALITRVLFRRSGLVYIQHLILAFNLHSFVFLWGATTIGWTRIFELFSHGAARWLVIASVLFTFWTYFRTVHEVFGRSWRATVVLGTIAGALYAFLLMNVIAAASLLVLLL